jgi:hypothetical protein
LSKDLKDRGRRKDDIAIWKKSILAVGNNRYKGCKAGVCLARLRNSRGADGIE